MTKSFKNFKKDRKGFTLVEMIVVLVILAILAAILVPALLGYIDDAKQKQYVLHAKSAYTAAQSVASEMYGVDAKIGTDTLAKDKDYGIRIADIADLDEFTGCTKVVIGFTKNYPDDGKFASNKDKHEVYTVNYVEYTEDGTTMYLINNEWTSTAPATAYANTKYTVYEATP